MLDEDVVLEHTDLGAIAALAHRHDPIDGFAPGQELRLGEDRRTAASGVAPVTAPLTLGLQPGRALDRADAVTVVDLARVANVHDRIGRVVARRHLVVGISLAPAPPAAPRRGGLGLLLPLTRVGKRRDLGSRFLLDFLDLLVRLGGGALAAASAPPAAATTAAAARARRFLRGGLADLLGLLVDL